MGVADSFRETLGEGGSSSVNGLKPEGERDEFGVRSPRSEPAAVEFGGC